MRNPLVSFGQNFKKEIQNGRNFYAAIFSSSWNSLGSMINTYDAVDPRNQAMRGVIARPASAADLVTSQPYIRNLVRNYERNNSTIRAATEGLVANIVGHGVWLEPVLENETYLYPIRKLWKEYCDDCGIDGMNVFELQTLACRDMVVAGEALWRFVVDKSRIDEGKIPVCVLPLESEWLGDSGNTVVSQTGTFVGGIELDEYGRPVAYMLTSPSGRVERVLAKWVSHIFERRRALQIRGEPWFSPVLTTLKQEKDLVMTELEAAKNSAGYAVAITQAGGVAPQLDEKGSIVRDIQIGSVVELNPGEGIETIMNNRPSQQIAPFRDMLRGDFAGALRLSRRWIDRDISNANYSSQRGDSIDQARLIGPVQEYFGRQSIGRLYKMVLPYICARLGIPIQKAKYRLVPDGQAYIDPQKDAEASALAIASGLSDYETECGRHGNDYKQIWAKLAAQQAEAKEMGLNLQTPGGSAFGEDPKEEESEKPEKKQERSVAPCLPEEDEAKADRKAEIAHKRALEIAEKSRQLPAPSPVFNLMPAAAPNVSVSPTVVNVRNEVPAQPPAPINVAAPIVNIDNRASDQPAPIVNIQTTAPVVNVTNEVSPTPVTIENTVVVPSRTIVAKPNSDGTVTMTPQG